MSRKVLEDWLQTDESKVVGQQVGGSKSEDHDLGAGSSNYSTKRSPTTQITCAASSPTSTATRPTSPKRSTSNTPTDATPSCDIRMQRTAGLRVYDMLAEEPGVELALI